MCNGVGYIKNTSSVCTIVVQARCYFWNRDGFLEHAPQGKACGAFFFMKKGV